MTRAVVRAMDVIEEYTLKFKKPVKEFFISGASKRGWTTWTTAAVDKRVIGMAPIVIDMLKIVPSLNIIIEFMEIGRLLVKITLSLILWTGCLQMSSRHL